MTDLVDVASPAGEAEALELPAPEPARPRHHGRWARRCPRCLATGFVTVEDQGPALRCSGATGCQLVLPPPRRSDELAPWETDPRLAGAWDDYSSTHPGGGLLARWGRSTDRADGKPLRDGDQVEEMPPQVRAVAILGEADELLDEERREYVERIEGLEEAIDGVKPLAIRLAGAAAGRRAARKKAPRPKPAPAPERHRPLRTAEEYSLRPPPPPATWRGIPFPDHDVVDEMAQHFRDAGEMAGRLDEPAADPAPPEPEPGAEWYYPRLAGALLGCVSALAFLAINALRARGVAYAGSTDQVHARVPRGEPYAGYRHAIAAAAGLTEHGESSALPQGAVATHALPQGMVLGQLACKPSRSHSARPREPDTGGADVWAAVRDARVGARTYSEGGEIRHEPGRPLTETEIELLDLVDIGQLHERALTSGEGLGTKVTRLAIEPLTPREALLVLRARGFDMTGLRTEHEAKLVLTRARKAIRRVLEDRGMIPGIAADRIGEVRAMIARLEATRAAAVAARWAGDALDAYLVPLDADLARLRDELAVELARAEEPPPVPAATGDRRRRKKEAA